MKIYRSVTIHIESGRVLAEDSYEYLGPVSECKGDLSNMLYQEAQKQQYIRNVQADYLSALAREGRVAAPNTRGDVEQSFLAALAREGKTWEQPAAIPPSPVRPLVIVPPSEHPASLQPSPPSPGKR